MTDRHEQGDTYGVILYADRLGTTYYAVRAIRPDGSRYIVENRFVSSGEAWKAAALWASDNNGTLERYSSITGAQL